MSESFSGPFHQSQIETYLLCPRQFYFRYVKVFQPEYRLGVSLIGEAAHKVVEMFHREGFENEGEIKETLLRSYRECLPEGKDEGTSDVPIIWKEGDFEAELDEAALYLEGYSQKEMNKHAKIISLELDFKVEIGGYEFEGRIDQLRENENGGLILVDFKTGRYRPSEAYLRRSFQFSLYAYAVREIFSQTPKEIWWYQMRDLLPPKRGKLQEKGPAIYKTFRSESELDYLPDDITQVCRAIQLEIFPRRPLNLGSCNGFCSFQETCLSEIEGIKFSQEQSQAIRGVIEMGDVQCET